MAKTLYDILEVSQTASPAVIKSAFRTLAAKLHPDTGSSTDEEAFKLVLHAHDTLSNPEKRAKYDARLLHGEEDLFLGLKDLNASTPIKTVKRRDGSDTLCTIDEHIRRKGVELSNTDLRWVSLYNLSLSGAPLDRVDFSNAKLENVNLTEASLKSICCNNATFNNVDFSKADFTGSSFKNCVFNACNFFWCDFSSASMQGSDFRGSSFVNTTLVNTDFSDSIFEGVLFSRIYPQVYDDPPSFCAIKCKFTRCNLRHAIFGDYEKTKQDKNRKMSCKGALCYRLSFEKVDFREANLSEAICKSSQFKSCDFTNTCLASAVLKNSQIIKPISFTGASLFGADFTGATLCETDFSTCNIINARFYESKRKNVLFPAGFVPPNPAQKERISRNTFYLICYLIFCIVFGFAVIYSVREMKKDSEPTSEPWLDGAVEVEDAENWEKRLVPVDKED